MRSAPDYNERTDKLDSVQVEALSQGTKIYAIYAVRVTGQYDFSAKETTFKAANNTYAEPAAIFRNPNGTALGVKDTPNILSFSRNPYYGAQINDHLMLNSNIHFKDYLKNNYKFAVIADASKPVTLGFTVLRCATFENYVLSNDGKLINTKLQGAEEAAKKIQPTETVNGVYYYSYADIMAMLNGTDFDPDKDNLCDLHFYAEGDTVIYGVYAVKTAANVERSGFDHNTEKTKLESINGTVKLWENADGFDIPYYIDTETNEDGDYVQHGELSVNGSSDINVASYINSDYRIAVVADMASKPVLQLYMTYKLNENDHINKRYWNGNRN